MLKKVTEEIKPSGGQTEEYYLNENLFNYEHYENTI